MAALGVVCLALGGCSPSAPRTPLPTTSSPSVVASASPRPTPTALHTPAAFEIARDTLRDGRELITGSTTDLKGIRWVAEMACLAPTPVDLTYEVRVDGTVVGGGGIDCTTGKVIDNSAIADRTGTHHVDVTLAPDVAKTTWAYVRIIPESRIGD